MKNKYNVIIAILIIILAIGILLIGTQLLTNDNSQNTPISSSNATSREVISNSSDDPGSVEVIKNVGNPNGEKIAYVVGA